MNLRVLTIFCTLALAVSGTLSGCASAYKPAPPAFHEALQEVYRLDAGDRLRITVFEQTDLTNTYSVDKAGYIAFPLVGSVPARGRTIKEIENKNREGNEPSMETIDKYYEEYKDEEEALYIDQA